MSLNWQWNEKVGKMSVECTTGKGEKRVENWTLYNGNALLIMLYEYTEESKEMWEMRSFFVDKKHANAMLGLTKGYDNNFNNKYTRLLHLELYKDKCKYMWDIIKAFSKAFDNLDLTISVSD